MLPAKIIREIHGYCRGNFQKSHSHRKVNSQDDNSCRLRSPLKHLSILHIITALMYKVMRFDPQNPGIHPTTGWYSVKDTPYPLSTQPTPIFRAATEAVLRGYSSSPPKILIPSVRSTLPLTGILTPPRDSPSLTAPQDLSARDSPAPAVWPWLQG